MIFINFKNFADLTEAFIEWDQEQLKELGWISLNSIDVIDIDMNKRKGYSILGFYTLTLDRHDNIEIVSLKYDEPTDGLFNVRKALFQLQSDIAYAKKILKESVTIETLKMMAPYLMVM